MTMCSALETFIWYDIYMYNKHTYIHVTFHNFQSPIFDLVIMGILDTPRAYSTVHTFWYVHRSTMELAKALALASQTSGPIV